MRKIALLAALALAVPVWAQPAKEPAKPAAQEPPKAEAAKPEPQKPVARKINPRRQQDARHCLGKASNTEIIKCAEAYL